MSRGGGLCTRLFELLVGFLQRAEREMGKWEVGGANCHYFPREERERERETNSLRSIVTLVIDSESEDPPRPALILLSKAHLYMRNRSKCPPDI